MKHYLISEIIYWVIAIISLFSFFENWGNDPNRSYIFLGFCILSIFMALFRRHFRLKYSKKINDNYYKYTFSAFFSGMEIAYVSSNRFNLEIEKNQAGLIPKILSTITRDPSRFIATMLIGNNFALVVYGIFMGQFIIDNLPFLNTIEMNELSIHFSFKL